MPSSKHERLYGAPAQKDQKKKVGAPMTPGQLEAMLEAGQVPDAVVEGGFVNDRTGEATERERKRQGR